VTIYSSTTLKEKSVTVSADSNSYTIKEKKYVRVSQLCNLYPKPWLHNWYKASHNKLCHISATTLAMLPNEPSPCGFEVNEAKSKDSMEFGTYVHELIEQGYPLGMEIQVGHDPSWLDRATKCTNAHKAWKDKHQLKTLYPSTGEEFECLIKSKKMEIAGRFDELALTPGKDRVLIEYKTGANRSGAHEIQAGFYSILLKEDWMISVDKVCIFYLEQDKPKWYNRSEIKKLEGIAMNYWRVWKHYKGFER